MTAYPGCAGLARSPFVLTEHISSLYHKSWPRLLASEQSERDTIRGVQIQSGAVYICMEVRVP